jgi:hypothetical protein
VFNNYPGKMNVIREMGFYFLTLMLVVVSITSVIPNLSTEEKKYDKELKIIDSIRVSEREYENKYSQKRIEYTLVITTTDKNEFYLSKSNLENWDSLTSVNLKGKKIEVLLRNTDNRTGNLNPMSVIIDGKTIMSQKENVKDNYIIVGLTILCVLYSSWLARKRLNSNNTSS